MAVVITIIVCVTLLLLFGIGYSIESFWEYRRNELEYKIKLLEVNKK